MAIILATVIVPGMFSASAAINYATPSLVVATDNSSNGSFGPYLATGSYGSGRLQFNVALEADAKYAVSFDYDGENWDKFGVYAYAAADPNVQDSVNPQTATKKHRFSLQKKKKTMRRYSNIIE